MLDIDAIMSRLPHRFPFLLVDRILEMDADKRIKALKNVTVNEPFFAGHFPSYPVMPGVLIVEAMAQAGGILAFESTPEMSDSLVFFTGIDGTRFRKPVRPGDQLILDLKVLKNRGHVWKFHGEASVDGDVVCESSLMASLVPPKKA